MSGYAEPACLARRDRLGPCLSEPVSAEVALTGIRRLAMTSDGTLPSVRAARVYLRVSTDKQDLTRRNTIVTGARAAGYHVAAVYREKASGPRPDWPELLSIGALSAVSANGTDLRL